jgi:hypothetical protein
MSSKDLSLDLVEHLNLLKKNKTDYLLICLDPGKNEDRADVWFELADKDSPKNLLAACLSLFTNVFKDKEELIGNLLEYCEELDEAYEEEENDISELFPLKPQKKKNKKTPPNDDNDGEPA